MATNGHHHKMEQQQQYASEGRTYTSSQQQEESVRQMEEIRHTNATLDVGQSDSFRAQTEQAAIRIVTPFYKKDDKPGAEMRIGSNAADLSAKFAQAEGADYKAERTAEHFRMQIIEPKVVSHAHIPAHATRDYARRHLVDDFPSLHGKRSFIDLEAMEQRKLRQQRILPEAGDRDRDLEKYLKNRDDDKQWKTPWPAQKPDDDSLREMDRLRQNIDHLQKARPIPKVERAVVKVETPAPLVRRKEVVEVRREVVKAPAVKHTVHRIEEKKRTEEVERRVLRKERRHKSRRMHRSHHSSSAAAGGGHHEYHYGSWGGGGGGGGFRSSSAQRGYTNGFGHGHGVEHQLPITYEGTRSARSAFDSSAASDHRFGGFRNGYGGGGMAHARYGSLSDSLRRGDLKYVPNGELRVNGDGKVKHHRVHKAHSTRDVFYRGDGGADQNHYSSFQRGGPPPPEPFVEFPPTLDRRSDWSGGPEPPPHRRHFDEFGAGAPRGITKARSYADWDEGRAAFGNRYDDDMARLEHEFRDARLMRIPNGKMDEKEHHHREIPGGYESYSRETKAHSSAQKLNGNSAAPAAEVQ